jgi:2-polyprenyl-3-methyl-5-hydroxy-6-metoxy-1,4-benzoquinol methylase
MRLSEGRFYQYSVDLMELRELEKVVKETFGKERGALLKVEIQHLIERGYSRRDLVKFLEKYGLSSGVFYTLSMIRRGNLSLEDMKKSAAFIFNSYSVIGKEVERYVPAGGKILDYGCGRGLISCALASKGFEVHGVDISNEPLDIAKKLADELHCRVSFHLIDDGKLPFQDISFDLVLSHWAFHEIDQDHQLKVVTELYRVLKVGGYVLIVDQEGVAPFTRLKGLMDQHDFKLKLEKTLLSVYDHGKASKAKMLLYRKR